ncbi:MAG TPA: S24 family peptidase [Acidocella sp.]|nr:S24 family peptidase [Acidocella sp.]
MDKAQILARDAVLKALKQTGLKPAQLAKRAGLAPSTLTRFLRATENNAASVKFTLSARSLQAIAEIVQQFETPSNAVRAVDAPAPPTIGPVSRDVPVLGWGECGEDGACQIYPDNVIDYVDRPARLIGTANVFALYLVGESMEPWASSGQIIYVSRDRPVSPGDYVLAEIWDDQPGQGPRALVKRLVRRTRSHIELEQYNPKKIITIPVTAKLYRVYGPWELAGIA